jgi:hypothetical protein
MLGAVDEAEAVIKTGLSRYHDDLRLMTEFAEVASMAKQWSVALSRWQAVLDTHDERAQANGFVRLARAQQELGAVDDAEAVLLWGLDRFPNNLPLMTAFASVAFKAKDLSNAVHRCRAVLDVHGNKAPAHIYVWLAQALYVLGATNDADEVVESALPSDPDNLLFVTQFPWRRPIPEQVRKFSRGHARTGLSLEQTFQLETECLSRLKGLPESLHFPALVNQDLEEKSITTQFKGFSLQCLSDTRTVVDVPDIDFQIVRIITGLMNCGIVHLDIKPWNIVVDMRGNVSLIDFGVTVIDRSPLTNRHERSLDLFDESGGYEHQGECLRRLLCEAESVNIRA